MITLTNLGKETDSTFCAVCGGGGGLGIFDIHLLLPHFGKAGETGCFGIRVC